MKQSKQLVLFLIIILNLLILSVPALAADIAITIDDFFLGNEILMGFKEKNEALLKALDNHKIKATLFIAGKRIEGASKEQELKKWDVNNHSIANHTYSHKNYHKTSFEVFSEDIKKCESMIKKYDNFKKLFRFPFLKQGETMKKRDKMRTFLLKEGYKIGYVTIDASDWYINQRLKAKLKQDPNTDLKPYKEYYLKHIWDRALYYDNLAKKVVGRDIKHTLLIHHNLLNALFLNDILNMFKNNGWNLVNASDAFSDEVFEKAPNNIPAGESLVWALAKSSGNYESVLRYPAESDKYEKPLMDKLGL